MIKLGQSQPNQGNWSPFQGATPTDMVRRNSWEWNWVVEGLTSTSLHCAVFIFIEPIPIKFEVSVTDFGGKVGIRGMWMW